MTFSAIYKYSLDGLSETYLRICLFFRFSPGLHHPALCSRVLLIRFSTGLHHPALRSRVLLIRFIPGLHHPAFHSRVLLFWFRPRPRLFVGTVLLPSHPEEPVSQQFNHLLFGHSLGHLYLLCRQELHELVSCAELQECTKFMGHVQDVGIRQHFAFHRQHTFTALRLCGYYWSRLGYQL